MSTNVNEQWLKRSITEQYIRYYEYENLTNRDIIGRGGYAVVYKATVKQCDIEIAIKQLLPFPPSVGKEEIYSIFVREVRTHRQVDDHPNIIRFLGLGEGENGIYSMVFEYAECTLQDHLCAHFANLRWADKYKLGLDVAKGLHYLHWRDILHKDLSSRNILVQRGVAKITDFGLAGFIREQTASSTRGGTLAYMDPMCLKYPDYIRNKKSDIFSLGVVLWEISTGKPPYDGQTDVQVMSRRIQDNREPSARNTPKEYLRLYSECWHDDPNTRPTCDVVRDRLRKLHSQIKAYEQRKSRTGSIISRSTLVFQEMFSGNKKIQSIEWMQPVYTSQSTLASLETIPLSLSNG